jgi:lipoprotein Spr
MVKEIITGLIIIGTLASCSSMKPVSYNSNRQTPSNAVPVANKNNKEVKFLDDITVETASASNKKSASADKAASGGPNSETNNSYLNRSSSLEKASELHLKYAILLNTEVEQVEGNPLLEHVDEWYGTRYRYGGTTKAGVDCSAFTQAIYLSAFAVGLPRTARDQFRNARIISATEMKTGDLVFFNTTGGISHVGIYLQNNKFVHASSAYGVTISDMFDPYYIKRFIGVGRVEKPEAKTK